MEDEAPQFFSRKTRMLWLAVKRKAESIAATEHLTSLQMHILFGIDSEEIKNIGGLCREFNIGHPNASIMCKRLESSGYLVRERSFSDERFVVLSLTEKGRLTVNKLKALISKAEKEIAIKGPDEVMKVIEGMGALEKLVSRGF